MVVGEVPGQAQQPVAVDVVEVAVAEQPDLRMKQVAGARPTDLVNHWFQEGQKVGWLAGDGDLAGLAEDIQPVRTGPDSLKTGYRIGSTGQREGCEGKGRDQGGV